MNNLGTNFSEVSRKGWEIYVNEIRPKVIENHRGEFLVVDVDSGEYEMDANASTAAVRMAARHPEGRRFMVRVGYKAAYSVGAVPQQDLA
jgi:hypothetical protein